MFPEESFARRKGLNLRDALIFLVDFRTPMLRPDPNIDMPSPPHTPDTPALSPSQISLLSITLRCIADILKSKIIARTRDLVGILAFGVRPPPPAVRQKWPGVRVVRALRPPDAAAVKQLQRLAQRLEAGEAEALLDMEIHEVNKVPVEEGDEDFCFGAGAVPFDKALWAARHQFTAVAATRVNVLHRKRVFVFTNDADPSRGNRAVRQLCRTQAGDLADLGATLEVSLLTSPGALGETDVAESVEGEGESGLFNELVYTEAVGGERGSVNLTTVYSFEEMVTRVRRQEISKRAIRKTVLVLGGEFRIGVALYRLVMKMQRPVKVELAACSNKPVVKITTTTCEATGDILKPGGVRVMYVPDYLKNARYRTPGVPRMDEDEEERGKPHPEVPEKVVYGFRQEEVVKAKALGRVGIHIYGFRKRSALRKELALGAPIFVFPDEGEYIGSTKAFACLLKCMLKKDVLAIASVRLSDKSGEGIRFAALVAQKEDFSEHLEQIVPGGLQLYYLPYRDDLYTAWRHELPVVDNPTPDEYAPSKQEDKPIKQEELETAQLQDEPESVSVARKLIQKLRIQPYSPHTFLNPDLQRFYAGLENAAGVEAGYNPQDELLNPATEVMQERAGVYAHELKRLTAGADFDGAALAEQFGTQSKKRTAEQSEVAIRKQAEKYAAREEAVAQCDDAMYVRRFHEGILDKLKKPALQLYCTAHGLHDRGLKKNLIIAIEEHIQSTLNDPLPPP